MLLSTSGFEMTRIRQEISFSVKSTRLSDFFRPSRNSIGETNSMRSPSISSSKRYSRKIPLIEVISCFKIASPIRTNTYSAISITSSSSISSSSFLAECFAYSGKSPISLLSLFRSTSLIRLFPFGLGLVSNY